MTAVTGAPRWGVGSALDRVRAAVEAAGLEPTKGEAARDFHFLCPVHGERNPSAHARELRGHVQLRCFSCDADRVALAGALGLRIVELYDEPPVCAWCGERTWHEDVRECSGYSTRKGKPTPATHRPATPRPATLGPLPKRVAIPGEEPSHRHRYETVCYYDYFDAQGTLRQQVERRRCTHDGCGEKSFTQIFFGPRGDRVKHLDGDPVLYRHPQILEAVAEGVPVWLVEGEKDADTAADAWKVPACTNACGAATIPDAVVPAFTGAHVNVVVDRDQAGYLRALKAVETLSGVAAAVSLLLPATPDTKSDLTDHVDAGYGLEDLVPATIDEIRVAESVAHLLKLVDGVLACRDQHDARLELARAAEADTDTVAEHQQAAHRWASEAVTRHGRLLDVARETTTLPGWGTDRPGWLQELLAAATAALYDTTRVVDDLAAQAGLTREPDPVVPPLDGAPAGDAAGAGGGGGHDLPPTDVPGPDDDEPAADNVVHLGGSGWQMPPRHSIPMSTGMWGYDTGLASDGPRRGVYREGKHAWLRVAPLPWVHAAVVREDGRRRRTGTDFLISVEEDDTPLLVTSQDLRDGSWANRLGLALSDDNRIQQAASTAIRHMAESARQVVATPRMGEDGKIQACTPETLPGGYLECTDGDRSEALQQWGRIISEVARSPKMALVLGAAAVGPFLEGLHYQSHIIAMYGDAAAGKSTTMKLAGAVWGDPSGTVASWNATAQGPTRLLGQLGCLPGILDEQGQMDLRGGPAAWGKLIYDITEGAQRLGAEYRGTGIRRTLPWHGVLISAGNGRLTEGLGAGRFAGVGRRVLDIPTPITVDQAHAETLTTFIDDDLPFGHLGLAVLDSYTAEDVARLIEHAASVVIPPANALSGSGTTITRALHAHIAGAAMIDRLVGTGTLLQDSAAAYARDHLAEWDDPPHDADRILAAIADSLARQPGCWPTESEAREIRKPRPFQVGEYRENDRTDLPQHGVAPEIHGLRSDDGTWLGVYSGAWRMFCTEEEIDSSVTLRELHHREVLIVQASARRGHTQGWQCQVKGLGRLYKIALPAIDPGPTPPPPDEAAPTPEPTTPSTAPAADQDPGRDANPSAADPSSTATGDQAQRPPTTAAATVAGTSVAGTNPRPVAGHNPPVAGPVAGADSPLTCTVAGVAGEIADSLAQTRARESNVLAAPVGGDIHPTDPPPEPATGPGEDGPDIPADWWEVWDDPCQEAGTCRTPDGRAIPIVAVTSAVPCCGCGHPTTTWLDGQPWHPTEWRASSLDQRANAPRIPVDVWHQVLTWAQQAPAQQAPAQQAPAQQAPAQQAPAQQAPAQRRAPVRARSRYEVRPETTVAVVDVDRVWLPDGSSRPLDREIRHVGHLEQLGCDLGLQVPKLSWSWRPGLPQVVPTRTVWQRLGLPVEQVPADADARRKWLADTDTLPLIAEAVREGWVFGREDDPTPPRVRTTIKTRPAGTGGSEVAILCLPVMEQELPALFDEGITPAQVARRLHRFTQTVGVPLSGSPISTFQDLHQILLPRKWRDVWVPIDFQEVEPARQHDVEDNFHFFRKPLESEAGRRYLHMYDRNASFLVALSSMRVGFGEPRHYPRGTGFDPGATGWWEITMPAADSWQLPDLLDPKQQSWTGRRRWVSSAVLEYMVRIHGFQPTIHEAWLWPADQSAPALKPLYTQLSNALKTLRGSGDSDDTAAAKLVQQVYKMGTGWWMSSKSRGTRFHQPAWYHAMRGTARIALHRTVSRIGATTGEYPILVANIDAVGYLSDEPDPWLMWPEPAKIDAVHPGHFKPYRSGLAADCLPYIVGGRLKAPRVPPRYANEADPDNPGAPVLPDYTTPRGGS